MTGPDVGNTLDVLVTASNTAGSGSSVSAVTAKVSAAPATTTTTAATAVHRHRTTEDAAPFTFTLSTATQPNIVSDTPGKGELNVPPGTVTFTVSNPDLEHPLAHLRNLHNPARKTRHDPAGRAETAQQLHRRGHTTARPRRRHRDADGRPHHARSLRVPEHGQQPRRRRVLGGMKGVLNVT